MDVVTTKGNASRCRSYYEKNANAIQIARIKKRLSNGAHVRRATLDKYNITMNESDARRVPMEEDTWIMKLFEELDNLDLRESTIACYKTRLRTLYECVPNGMTFEAYVRDPEHMVSCLKTKYPESYCSFLSPLISISKNESSVLHCWYVENEAFFKSILYSGRMELLDRQELTQIASSTIDWVFIKLFVETINDRENSNVTFRELPEPFSQDHVLITLMYIQTIRDDYGDVVLVSTNRDSLDETYIGHTKPNAYDADTGILYLNAFKTVTKFGPVQRYFPTGVAELIRESVRLYPRTHLIEVRNTRGSHVRKLTSYVPKMFARYTGVAISINDMRHSKIAHHHSLGPNEFPRSAKSKLAQEMLHGLDTAMLIYDRVNTFVPGV